MDWIAALRTLRAARIAAFSDADRSGSSLVAQATNNGYDIRVVGSINWWFGTDVLVIVDEVLEARPESVNLYLDSPGGDLFDAMALRAALDSLAQTGTHIQAQAGGIVASAAVPVFLTGAVREAQTYTRFMVHNPRAWFVVEGTLADMDSAMVDFRSLMEAATGLYWDSISSHVDAATVTGWQESNQDVWHTAAEAEELGILTGATDEPPVNSTDGIEEAVARLAEQRARAVAAFYQRQRRR